MPLIQSERLREAHFRESRGQGGKTPSNPSKKASEKRGEKKNLLLYCIKGKLSNLEENLLLFCIKGKLSYSIYSWREKCPKQFSKGII
jgi:hypothetical protein